MCGIASGLLAALTGIPFNQIIIRLPFYQIIIRLMSIVYIRDYILLVFVGCCLIEVTGTYIAGTHSPRLATTALAPVGTRDVISKHV